MSAMMVSRGTRWTWAGLNGLLILAIAYALAIVLSILASPWLGGQQDPLAVARLSVTWGEVGPQPDLPAGSTLEQVGGTLRVETGNPVMVAVGNAPDLLAAIGLAFVLFNLREVIARILLGAPFVDESRVRLRRVGYTGLALGFLVPLVQFSSSLVLLARLTPAGTSLMPGAAFNVWAIIGGMLSLVLSQVWIYGLELERDRALTI